MANPHPKRRITCLEPQEEISVNASNGRTRNFSNAGQRACRICNSTSRLGVNALALVEHNHMDVYLSPSGILEDKVPVRCLAAMLFFVAPLFQDFAQTGDGFGLDRDIEIAVRSALAAKYRIYRPAAIDQTAIPEMSRSL